MVAHRWKEETGVDLPLPRFVVGRRRRRSIWTSETGMMGRLLGMAMEVVEAVCPTTR